MKLTRRPLATIGKPTAKIAKDDANAVNTVSPPYLNPVGNSDGTFQAIPQRTSTYFGSRVPS